MAPPMRSITEARPLSESDVSVSNGQRIQADTAAAYERKQPRPATVTKEPRVLYSP